DGAPQAELRFIGRLSIRNIGRAAAAGPPGQSDVPRKLARAQRRLNMLGCSEGRGTRFHVDVGGETSIDHWCTRMGQLRQGDAGERLSVLERESAGNGDG